MYKCICVGKYTRDLSAFSFLAALVIRIGITMDYTWALLIFLIVICIGFFAMRSSPSGPVEGHGEFDIVPTNGGSEADGESWDV